MNGPPSITKWSMVVVITSMLQFASSAARAADVTYYVVGKDEGFDQLSAGPPTPKGNPYRFNAIVGLAAANSVTNATTQLLPGGPIYPLGSGTSSFEFQAKFLDLISLNAAAPNGNYQLVIHTVHDGTKTITLPLNGDAYPGTDPHINNFPAAQAINPGAAFPLTWDPFSAGTANDFIQVTIADVSGNIIFQSPNPGQPSALNGTATSLVIPGNTLPSATTLFGQLLIAKAVAVDTTSYAGVIGFASYYKFTQFSLVTVNPLPAQDVTGYSIAKQQTFDQNDAGSPVADAGIPFRFVATVLPTTASSISNVNVQLPGGAIKPLAYNAANAFFRFQQSFPAQGGLDAAYVPGLYTLTLAGVHDGDRTLPLTLVAGVYPNAPHVNNFTAAQSINPAADFNLTWDAFAGAAAADDILLTVVDGSGNPYTSGSSMLSTTTNFNFPANTFPVGQSYQATLNFRKFTSKDTSTYMGTTGSVFFSSRTLFNLVAPSNSPPPRLVALTPNNAGQFQLQLVGQSGLQYVIEASTNLQSGFWLPVITNAVVGGQFNFIDTQSAILPLRFYRGRTAN